MVFTFKIRGGGAGGGKGFLGQDELSATLSTHNDQFLHTEDSMNGFVCIFDHDDNHRNDKSSKE